VIPREPPPSTRHCGSFLPICNKFPFLPSFHLKSELAAFGAQSQTTSRKTQAINGFSLTLSQRDAFEIQHVSIEKFANATRRNPIIAAAGAFSSTSKATKHNILKTVSKEPKAAICVVDLPVQKPIQVNRACRKAFLLTNWISSQPPFL
jgi:hypothetical protein